jgi:hypothetical protein
MADNDNIELRKNILSYALTIEHLVNELILMYLAILNKSTRSFGNRSGSLSFKSKIDLLYDIEVLTKQEHADLELLMVFRNQFLHNLSCNSFSVAVTLFDRGIEKRLLSFSKDGTDSDDESRYSSAYGELYYHCLKIIGNKIARRKQIISNKSRVLTEPMEHSIFYIDVLFNFFDELLEKCMPQYSENKDLTNFKIELACLVSKKSKSIKRSKKYKIMKSKLEEITNGTLIDDFLKG